MDIYIDVVTDSAFVMNFNLEVPSESSTSQIKNYIRDQCLNNYGYIVDDFFILVTGPGWRILNKTDIIKHGTMIRVNCRSALEHFSKSQLEFQNQHLLRSHSLKL